MSDSCFRSRPTDPEEVQEEQADADNEDREINIAGDSTFGPAINMAITEDPWTKKRLFYYLRAYEEGENSTEYLRYCPFCGKKLTEITK